MNAANKIVIGEAFAFSEGMPAEQQTFHVNPKFLKDGDLIVRLHDFCFAAKKGTYEKVGDRFYRKGEVWWFRPVEDVPFDVHNFTYDFRRKIARFASTREDPSKGMVFEDVVNLDDYIVFDPIYDGFLSFSSEVFNLVYGNLSSRRAPVKGEKIYRW